MMDERGVYTDGAFGWPACTGHGAAQREHAARALRPTPKPVTGRCAVCGAVAKRLLSNSRLCHTHYRQAATLCNHGITNPVSVLRELLGKPKEVQAVPVAPSPPGAPARTPILSLTERLRQRRAAGR